MKATATTRICHSWGLWDCTQRTIKMREGLTSLRLDVWTWKKADDKKEDSQCRSS